MLTCTNPSAGTSTASDICEMKKRPMRNGRNVSRFSASQSQSGSDKMLGTGGGAPTVSTISPQATARYRVGLIVSILNITNHANFDRDHYLNTYTSPSFGEPTSILPNSQRQSEFGLRFKF